MAAIGVDALTSSKTSIALDRPRQAGHGDLASNLAMQLARPLRQPPRAVAAVAARRAPARRRRRDDRTGRGGRARLHQPLAHCRAPSRRWSAPSCAKANGSATRPPPRPGGAAGVRVRQSDRPPARRPRPPGRPRRCPRQHPRHPGLEGGARVLLQRRRRADQQPRAVGAGALPRARPGGPGVSRPTAIAANTSTTSRRPTWPAARSAPRRLPPVVGKGDPDDLDAIRRFAVASLRHEQDLDLQAFGVALRPLLPRVLAVRRRAGRADRRPPGRRRQDLRAGRRAVAAHHRLR